MNANIGVLGEAAPVVTLLFLLAAGLLHFMAMVCVLGDANRLRERGRSTVILTPFVWALAALIGGLIAVGLYWLFHHSRLAGRDR